MADFDYFYTLQVGSNKKLVDYGPTQNRFPKLQKGINLLEGVASRGGTFAIYSDLDGTPAEGTVTWTGTLSHGAGSSNAAFTFTAGSAGACTVTVGSHAGVTITGSGTAATDATALAAALDAIAELHLNFTITANAGDVRIVAKNKGGYNYTTTVTATGGGKLSAAGAALTGGNTGSLGNVVVKGVTVAIGSVPTQTSVGQPMSVIAAQAEAAIEASAGASLYVLAESAVVAGDAVLTLISKVPAPLEVLGNLITLTASVGTASGATLSGGVNATDNTSVY